MDSKPMLLHRLPCLLPQQTHNSKIIQRPGVCKAYGNFFLNCCKPESAFAADNHPVSSGTSTRMMRKWTKDCVS